MPIDPVAGNPGSIQLYLGTAGPLFVVLATARVRPRPATSRRLWTLAKHPAKTGGGVATPALTRRTIIRF